MFFLYPAMHHTTLSVFFPFKNFTLTLIRAMRDTDISPMSSFLHASLPASTHISFQKNFYHSTLYLMTTLARYTLLDLT